jgi:2'-hydroxyisoflavone reductase
MTGNRRTFVKTAVAAGAGAVVASQLGGRLFAADEPEGLPVWRRPKADRAGKPLKILILGGTGFLGPHTVDYALARGHQVTLFNRGKRNPGMFPNVETILGDRDGKLDGLKDRKWDAVVDNSGYVPRIVKMSADLLAPNVGQYLFISSISVFGETPKPGADETAPTDPLTEPNSEEVMKYYGALKAACERAAEASMPGRATTIRPGLIVGPLDPTDRFTYWPVRIAKGGEVLCPPADDPTQIIDVRDLAAFIVKCLEDRNYGIFNATGPEKELSFKAMLEATKKAAKSDANLVFTDAAFLEKNEVAAWAELPSWVPGTGDTAGFSRINCRKAISKGLKFRPVEEIVEDTLKWWATLPAERQAKLKAGLAPEKEAKVLAAWKEMKKAPKGS